MNKNENKLFESTQGIRSLLTKFAPFPIIKHIQTRSWRVANQTLVSARRRWKKERMLFVDIMKDFREVLLPEAKGSHRNRHN